MALAAYLTPLIWPGALLAGDILALVSVGLGGAPIVWGALRGLVRREVNVDELVSLAIVAALLQGEFLTAARGQPGDDPGFAPGAGGQPVGPLGH